MGDIVPTINDAYNLGSATNKFSEGHFTEITSNSINLQGHILPTTNDVYDLGSAGNRFGELHVNDVSVYGHMDVSTITASTVNATNINNWSVPTYRARAMFGDGATVIYDKVTNVVSDTTGIHVISLSDTMSNYIVYGTCSPLSNSAGFISVLSRTTNSTTVTTQTYDSVLYDPSYVCVIIESI
jgi:hypothetical protein